MSSDEVTTMMEAHHQHVLARITDWQASSFSIKAPDQTIGRKDKTVVLEVVTMGPGNVSRGTLNECTLVSGDLIIANLYHRSHELLVFGQSVSTFNWENIMAKIEVDDINKTVGILPLQSFVVCRTNEKRAQRVMMGEKSAILNPNGDALLTGEAFDERGKPRHQLKIACEEVVSVGPGSVVDGLYQVPNCQPGDMVYYDTSTTPISFTAAGQSFTLVHSRCIVLSFRDIPKGSLPDGTEASTVSPDAN